MKRFKLLLASVGMRSLKYPFASPPMGILSLSAYVRRQFPGAEIQLIDQRLSSAPREALVKRIADFAPDIVGFSSMTPYAHLLETLAQGTREALPNALIVIGGPHVSAFQREAMETIAADVAVVGEGELALEQVINHHLDGVGFDGVAGLIWRDQSGEIIENPGQMPLIENVDALPFPAYDLLDVSRYWKLPSMSPLPARRYVGMFTSRGCPFRCTYCHNVFGKRYRAQSAERVIAEVEHLTRTYELKEIEFYDDTFNYDPQRVIEFNALRKKKDLALRINFPNALRTDMLTEEVLDALVESGLYHSAFALESGSPRIQKLIRKNLNIPKYLENVALAVKKGVFAYGFIILGFPTETEEELKLTIDVACASRLHTASFFTVIPFPHTALYELAMQTHPERLAQIQYDRTDCYSASRVNCSEVPDDVFFACSRTARRRFFLSPKRIFRIVRDYPQRSFLPYYGPALLWRMSKGLIERRRESSE